MSFIEQIKERAKKDIKTIILPEAEDIRTLEATETILKEGYAKIILIGKKEKILELAKTKQLKIEKAEIIDPSDSEETEKYSQKLSELRKEKGMTEEKAR